MVLKALDPKSGQDQWASASEGRRKLMEYNFAPRVVLHDEKALPLLGAHVEATVLFNARANDLTTATLSDEGAGVYTATVPINTPGEWEVRVNAKRDTSHFTSSSRITAVRAAGTGR